MQVHVTHSMGLERRCGALGLATHQPALHWSAGKHSHAPRPRTCCCSDATRARSSCFIPCCAPPPTATDAAPPCAPSACCAWLSSSFSLVSRSLPIRLPGGMGWGEGGGAGMHAEHAEGTRQSALSPGGTCGPLVWAPQHSRDDWATCQYTEQANSHNACARQPLCSNDAMPWCGAPGNVSRRAIAASASFAPAAVARSTWAPFTVCVNACSTWSLKGVEWGRLQGQGNDDKLMVIKGDGLVAGTQ